MKGMVMHMQIAKMFGLLGLVGLALLCLGSRQAEAADVYGNLSNFDLRNWTGTPVNDLELTLSGNGLTCADIREYFPGWGTTSGNPAGGCQDLGSGLIRIKWSDPNAIPNGQYKHFGVRLYCSAPKVFVVNATWTLNGSVVGQVPVIWQTWDGSTECPVFDTIWPPQTVPPAPVGPPWLISRSWAYSPNFIPLNNLTWDDPAVTGLVWHTWIPETMTGAPLGLFTDPMPQSGAVLVRYSVRNSTGDTLGYYVNEAPLELSACPSLTGYGMIVLGVALLVTAVWIVRKRRAGVSVV